MLGYMVLGSQCVGAERTDSGGTGDRPLVQCKGLYVLRHSLSLHLDLKNEQYSWNFHM